MFDTLEQAFSWAKKKYGDCSFSVHAQADGQTMVAIKGKGETVLQIVYVGREKKVEVKRKSATNS